MESDKRTYTFLQLRDYLNNLYAFNNPDEDKWHFNKIMGRIITGKYTADYDIHKNEFGTQFGEKTIERILCKKSSITNGRFFLNEEEAKLIAEQLEDENFKEKYNLYDKSGILQLLVNEFINAYKKSNSKIPEKFRNLPEQHGTEKIIMTKPKDELEIELWKKGNFVYLQGEHGTGKNYIALSKAHELYKQNEVNYAFFIDCQKNKVTSPEDFYRKILFFLEEEEFKSLKTTELSKRAAAFICKNNTLVYIESFEALKNPLTQKHIITFLLRCKKQQNDSYLYVIITSNKRIETFPYISEEYFSKIEITEYKKSDFKEYFDYLRKEKEIKEALSLCNNKQKKALEDFLISKSTDLSFLKRSLFYLAKRIKDNEDIEELIQGFFQKDIFKFESSVYNYLEELSEESHLILVALLLF